MWCGDIRLAPGIRGGIRWRHQEIPGDIRGISHLASGGLQLHSLFSPKVSLIIMEILEFIELAEIIDRNPGVGVEIVICIVTNKRDLRGRYWSL